MESAEYATIIMGQGVATLNSLGLAAPNEATSKMFSGLETPVTGFRRTRLCKRPRRALSWPGCRTRSLYAGHQASTAVPPTASCQSLLIVT